MSEKYQVGEVGWDDVEVNGSPGSGSGIFLSMKNPGSYRVRVTSKPYQYYLHWVDNSAGKRIKVNSALDNCPVTLETGKAPQVKWMVKILHKNNDGSLIGVKVLDAGPQIMGQLRALKADPNWGSLTEYDVSIVKGRKGTNPLYKINPIPKSPFTEEEKTALRKSMDSQSDNFIDLNKLTEPWTPEKIKERMYGKSDVTADTSAMPESSSAEVLQAEDEDFLDL